MNDLLQTNSLKQDSFSEQDNLKKFWKDVYNFSHPKIFTSFSLDKFYDINIPKDIFNSETKCKTRCVKNKHKDTAVDTDVDTDVEFIDSELLEYMDTFREVGKNTILYLEPEWKHKGKVDENNTKYKDMYNIEMGLPRKDSWVFIQSVLFYLSYKKPLGIVCKFPPQFYLATILFDIKSSKIIYDIKNSENEVLYKLIWFRDFFYPPLVDTSIPSCPQVCSKTTRMEHLLYYKNKLLRTFPERKKFRFYKVWKDRLNDHEDMLDYINYLIEHYWDIDDLIDKYYK